MKTDDYKIKAHQLAISPYIYSSPSISSISIRFIILLTLQIFMLVFTRSYDALIVVFSAILGSAVAAGINCVIHKKEYYQIMNMVIQGMLIGLLLPETFPPLPVFFITFLTLFFSRHLIFKSVNSWLNMVAFAVLIAWVTGRNYFPGFLVTSDILSLRNSSIYLLQNGTFPIYNFDSTITSVLNSTVFSIFRVSIPEGFVSMLWDSGNVIPAFRFTLLTIISSVIVFSDNTFSGIVPVIFLLSYTILVRLFCPLIFGGLFNQGDIILALSSSGILFCTVFLIQWFGTVPVTISGKIISGLSLGVCSFLIIGCGTSPIGMMYTILINNIITLYIRSIEERKCQSGLVKVITRHPIAEEAGF